MNQRTFLDDPNGRSELEVIEIEDASLRWNPRFLDPDEADRAFSRLHEETRWMQERIRIHGREVAVPRLVAWHGDPDSVYVYSGVRHEPAPWSELLAGLRDRVSAALKRPFNSVLLNLYRDGNDSMGWHSDDEPELGERPCIASLSLGAERPFQLKHRLREEVPRVSLPLPHGSLLVMAGDCQRFWRHQLPKRVGKRAPGPRINLTFRHVQTPPR